MRIFALLTFIALAATVTACGGSSNQTTAAGTAGTTNGSVAPNPTDLPTYPNLSSASVIGGGKGTAVVYNASSPDAYETVLAWYRGKLTGATEQQSGYFKDTVTFHVENGTEQVMIAKDGSGTDISLGADAK